MSSMEIEECCQPDTFQLSSQTVQHTPISSQVVPLDTLDLSSQCSNVPMTPEKSISTPKSRKRKGYRARKDRNRAAIKKRRSDDSEFCKTENESRLERFNIDCEDPDFLAKHSENHLRDITKRLKDPEKRAEHNCAVAERLNDPEKRAEHNCPVAEGLKDPDVREKHNKYVLEKYRTNRDEVSSVIQSYFSQISQGPTYVYSCCGCLHFRKTVVILKREKLVSTNESNPDFVKQVIIFFYVKYYYNYLLNKILFRPG